MTSRSSTARLLARLKSEEVTSETQQSGGQDPAKPKRNRKRKRKGVPDSEKKQKVEDVVPSEPTEEAHSASEPQTQIQPEEVEPMKGQPSSFQTLLQQKEELEPLEVQAEYLPPPEEAKETEEAPTGTPLQQSSERTKVGEELASEPTKEQTPEEAKERTEVQPVALVASETGGSILEGNSVLFHDSTSYKQTNFLKNVKWSPDGKCLLSNSEDHILRLYEVTEHDAQQASHFQPVLKISEGEDIYDFAWFPFMRSEDPSTCAFLSTSRDHPIHLWDAYTGRSRTSYVAYDDADEPSAAYSLCFNPTGDKIFAGYNKRVCVWNVSQPGRDYKSFKTVPVKSNRPQKRHVSHDLSLNGVVSVIQCNPDYSGLVACGSYNKQIGIYAEKNFEPLVILDGHVGGITHLKWSPCGNYLYSGARKDNFIHCWDIRNTCTTLFKMERECTTNQRMYFDIDPSGSYLHTGDQSGNILVYDLNNAGQLLQKQALYTDSCNTVILHPTKPFVASASGQRRFSLDDEEEDIKPNPTLSVSSTPHYYYYVYPHHQHHPDSALAEWNETENMMNVEEMQPYEEPIQPKQEPQLPETGQEVLQNHQQIQQEPPGEDAFFSKARDMWNNETGTNRGNRGNQDFSRRTLLTYDHLK